MNEKQILLPLLSQQEGFEQTVLDRVDQELVDLIADRIFSMKTLGVATPVLIDAGIDYAAEYLGLTDFEAEGEATSEQIKSFFRTVFHSGFALYLSIDPENAPYVQEPAFGAAGELLDALRTYPGFTAENYATLLDALEVKLKTLLDEKMQDDSEFMPIIKEHAYDIIEQLSEIESFAADFEKLGSAYDAIVVLIERDEGADLPFAAVGEILDAVKETALFGESIVPLMSDVLSEGKSQVTDYPYLQEALDTAIAKLGSVQSWAAELDCFSGFEVLTELGQTDNIQEVIRDENSTFLHELGVALDGFEQSVLLGGQIKGIVSGFLSDESLTGEVEMAKDAVEQMKNNLETAENLSWTAEFDALQALMPTLLNMPDEIDREAAEKVGAALDSALTYESVLLSRSVLNTAMKSALDEVSRNVTEIDLTGIVAETKRLIDSEPISYEREISAIYGLFDEVKKLDTSSLESMDFAALGAYLDEYGPEGETPAVLVGEIRGDLVSLMLDQVKEQIDNPDIVAVLEKMKDNVPSIVSYEEEFVMLKRFSDQTEELSNLNGDSDPAAFERLGSMLDSFAASKLIANVRADLLAMAVDQIVITTDHAEVNAAVEEILENTKLCARKADAAEPGYTYTALFNDLGTLKDMVSGIPEVVINRDNFDITIFGEKLDELNELIIVPHSAVVRISASVTERIEDALEQLVSPFLSYSAELKAVYEELTDYTGAHLAACDACLDGTSQITFEFTKVYGGMYEIVAEVMEKLPA